MKGSLAFTTNACPPASNLVGGSNGATVKWKGASHYTTSVMGTSSNGAFLTPDGTTFALFDTLGGVAPVTGSFAGSGYPSGDGLGLVFGMTPTATQVQTACTPKTKGVPGSGGLKSANVSGAAGDGYILAT